MLETVHNISRPICDIEKELILGSDLGKVFHLVGILLATLLV